MSSFGEGTDYHDLTSLPPRLLGMATSYGSQSATPPELNLYSNLSIDLQNSYGSASGLYQMPPPTPPPSDAHPHSHPSQSASYQEHPSNDVLNTAATLMQNKSRLYGTHENNKLSDSRCSLGPLVDHFRHQPLEEFKEECRNFSALIVLDYKGASGLNIELGRAYTLEDIKAATKQKMASK